MSTYSYLSFSNYNFIFTLYLIIAVNFIGPTFSCNLQKNLYENMYLKHLIGFFTLFFFITLGEKVKTEDEYLYFRKMASAVLLYCVFILSTRMSSKFFWTFIILVCCNFIVRNYMDTLDPTIFKKKIDNLELVSNILVVLSCIVIIVGIILYYLDKRAEHGKSFDHGIFIFGMPKCKSI